MRVGTDSGLDPVTFWDNEARPRPATPQDAPMPLHLTIGNKNYSSWSFRPWLALKAAGIPFEETVIPLYVPGSKEQLLARSPAGKVPILQDGPVTVWESLAILRRNSPMPGCGRRMRRRAPMPAPLQARCMRASCRCAGSAR
jgi:hypothetical protein